MLETEKFLGLNIESYLNYDGKALRMASKHFFIFKMSILIFIVHSLQNQLKMTKKNGPGGRRHPVWRKEIVGGMQIIIL